MTAFALPDSSLDVLHAARDKGESAWREIANELANVRSIARGAPLMAIYQAVAVEVGKGVSTVREYDRFETELGDVLDELPMVGIAHIRLAYQEARRRGLSPRAVLMEKAQDADNHAGRYIPVDNWAAQIRTGRVKPEQPAHALECAVRNLTTALKHAEAKQLYGMVHKIKESLWAAQAALEKLESR